MGTKERKTGGKKRKGESLWKLTPRMEIAQNADFHRGLKKPHQGSAFSQFPQANNRPSTMKD